LKTISDNELAGILDQGVYGSGGSGGGGRVQFMDCKNDAISLQI
jgi:hypothetical protein